MNSILTSTNPSTLRAAESHTPYARALAASKRARWSLDDDVLRGRALDTRHKYLPDGLTLATSLELLDEAERRFFSQVQGRTYANMFGLVERYIAAKVLELGRDHSLGDQIALEALVRFGDEELKHQELFRRVEQLAAREMPAGYRFLPDPNQVARAVLSQSTWAVLALTCHIELFTLAHYKQSIEPDENLSPLFKDVLLYHWKEESQHAVLDEIEWRREDSRLAATERSAAVTGFIQLVAAVDGILQQQAAADADYFLAVQGRARSAGHAERIHRAFLRAYRYQYIGSGVALTRFPEVLFSLVSEADASRIKAALGPLL